MVPAPGVLFDIHDDMHAEVPVPQANESQYLPSKIHGANGCFFPCSLGDFVSHRFMS